jgi:two-component system response regulator LytT
MKVLIIEDERLNADRLKKILADSSHDIELLDICTSVQSSLEWFQKNDNPDLLLLDIQLNDGTGFDVLEKIGTSIPVIFTTAYDQYTLRAFKFHSIDYLLKPIQPEELNTAFDKYNLQEKPPNIDLGELKSILKGNFKSRFLVKIGEQFQTISSVDIAYFMSEENCTYMITSSQKTLPIDYSLEQLASVLDPSLFFRISRKFIVSMPAVKQIHTYFNGRLILKLEPESKEDVIVSRERVNDFKGWADS